MLSPAHTPDFAAAVHAASWMVGFKRPWGIAGGWGLDLWLGRITRSHGRVRVAVLRDHQIELRDYLAGWTFKIAAMDGRLVPWKDTRQMLMQPVHTLHATDRIGQQCVFELHESDGIDWIFRHDFSLRMNLSRLLTHGHGHVPVLNPLIELLYKSQPKREKDELDFRAVVDRLDDEQRTWLKLAIVRIEPWHGWVDLL